jgi:hypothetical protein
MKPASAFGHGRPLCCCSRSGLVHSLLLDGGETLQAGLHVVPVARARLLVESRDFVGLVERRERLADSHLRRALGEDPA